MLLGTDSIEVDGTEPQPDDATGGPCLDMVVCSFSPNMPMCTTLGDAVPAPGFSSAMDLGVTRLGLLGSSSSPSTSSDWGQVENSAKQACSWVAAADKLLREAMTMVGRDILHPIWVSLKEKRKIT
jgi:hypothetical protein